MAPLCMRFGRVVFLAGLAPLLGFAAAVSAHPQLVKQTAALEAADTFSQSLASLLRSVVVLVSIDSDGAGAEAKSDRPAPQAMLPLTALAGTRLHHSLWMVERAASGGLPARAPLPLPLRC